MFSHPQIKTIVSIFWPVGDYAVDVTYKRVNDHASKRIVTPVPFFEARRRALVEVIDDTFASAVEVGLLSVGIFFGVRFLHWF